MKRFLIVPLLGIVAMTWSAMSVDASGMPVGFHRLSGLAVVASRVAFYHAQPLAEQTTCPGGMPAGYSCVGSAAITPNGWTIDYGPATTAAMASAARTHPKLYGTLSRGQRLHFDGYVTRKGVRWFHFVGGWIVASELWRPFAWRR